MAKKATTGKKAKKAPAAKPKPAAEKVEKPIEKPVAEPAAEKVEAPPVVFPPEEIVTPPEKDPVEETPEPEVEVPVSIITLTYHPTGRVIGFRDGVRMDGRHIRNLAHIAGYNSIIEAFSAMKVKRGKSIVGPVGTILKKKKQK